MHYVAPIPIILGAIGVIVGFLWLIAAGADEDGGPSPGLFFLSVCGPADLYPLDELGYGRASAPPSVTRSMRRRRCSRIGATATMPISSVVASGTAL